MEILAVFEVFRGFGDYCFGAGRHKQWAGLLWEAFCYNLGMRKLLLGAAFIISIPILFFSLNGLHENYNSSNLYGYGRGTFTVTSCKAVGKSYECLGNFWQHGGMISADNLTLLTAKFYSPSTSLDIYLHYSQSDENNLNADNTKIETAAQRRSLANNFGYMLGCLPALAIGLYGITKFAKHTKK
jgi:hypothetical protein